MKMTSVQKMIVAAALVLVAAAMVVAFAIMPQFDQLNALQEQRSAAEARSQQATAVLARLQGAKGRAAVTEAETLKVGTQMPDSPQLPTLIMEMQDIANASGVKVTSIAPGQPVASASGKFTEISLATQVTAEWDDLLDYLKRLDRSTRLLRVVNLSVNPPAAAATTTGTPAPTALTVTMAVKSYVIGINGVLSSAATTTVGTP